MPGFEINRFVSLSQIEKNELLCSICQNIFRSPVFTNCCRQTFCEDCINEWLKTNNSCPYDRGELNKNQLSWPPRLLINLLGRLEIMCDYRENGCEKVLLLEDLTKHSQSCGYKIKKCTKCLCVINIDHDCIKTLLEENEELKTKFKSVVKELDQLKLEKLSDREILNEARKYLLSFEIMENETSKEMTIKIVQIVKEEIGKLYILDDVLKNVVYKLNYEFGEQWHCIAIFNHSSKYCSIFQYPYLIKLKFGKVLFEIFKSKSFDLNLMKQRIRSGKIKREITILKSVMTETFISDLKSITFSAIDKFETLSEIANHIKKEIDNKFGGSWQCFLYSRYGHIAISHRKERLIDYKVDGLNIILFQAY